MKDLLTEIKEIVKEELSISDEVLKTKNALVAAIIKDSKNMPKHDSKFADYMKQGILFKYPLFGEQWIVIYKIFYIKSNAEYDNLISNIEAGKTSPNGKVYVNLIYIADRNNYTDIEGEVQHELEHIYQVAKKKKWIISSQLSADIYSKAQNLKNNGTTIGEQLVGFTLYYNNNFERDVFTNGIYSMMIDNNVTEPLKFIKNTVNYKNVLTVERVVEAGTYKEEIDKVVKSYFGKSYGWWKKIALRMVSTYKVKIGKAVAKYTKDYLGPDKALIGNNTKIEGLK